MSQENMEIVRRAFEAATRRPRPDIETLTELAHPDHEITTDYGAMGADSFLGIEGFRKALTEFDVDWGEWHQEFDEFLEAGDDAVVVLGHLVARGQSTRAGSRCSPATSASTARRFARAHERNLARADA